MAVMGLTILSASPAYAQKCDQDLINQHVAYVQKNMDSNPAGQAALKQIQNSIDNGNLDPKNKDKAVRLYLEIAIRNAGNCGVPEKLQSEATYLFNSNKGGTKTCQKDMFLKQANTQFDELQSMPDYPKFEAMAKQRMQSNMVPSVQAMFGQKWDADPALREKLIVASIQAGLRQEEGCKNVALPIAPLISEMAQ